MSPVERLIKNNPLDYNRIKEDAMIATSGYVELMKKFGLIHSDILRNVDQDSLEVRTIESVTLSPSDGAIDINFTFNISTKENFCIKLRQEIYNSLVLPEQFSSNWKIAFYRAAKEYVDNKVEEELLVLGKWIDRSDTLRKLIEKSGE